MFVGKEINQNNSVPFEHLLNISNYPQVRIDAKKNLETMHDNLCIAIVLRFERSKSGWYDLDTIAPHLSILHPIAFLFHVFSPDCSALGVLGAVLYR